MSRFEGVKAVFFDVDDTLYDFAGSMELAFAHMRQAFPDAFGKHEVDELSRAYWAFYDAVPEARKVHLINHDPDLFRRTMWAGALANLGHEVTPEDRMIRTLTDEFQRHRPAHWRASMYAGADALLRDLKPRVTLGATAASEASEDQAESRGYILGVITNGPSLVQRPKLEALRYRDYFEERMVFVSGEFGARKPDPSIFQAAAKAAGADPQECVMVGDALQFDMPAKALGFRTILFCGPRDVPDVSAQPHPPDAVACSYDEIRRLLL